MQFLKNRKSSKQGHLLLETLLASGVLALLSLSLLEGVVQQSRINTMNNNRLEAFQVLNVFKSRWTSGLNLPEEHKGTLKTGYSFKITIEEDKESHPPLEKASITVFWKEPHVKEPKFLQTYGIRIS